jgi:hypothetical protein
MCARPSFIVRARISAHKVADGEGTTMHGRKTASNYEAGKEIRPLAVPVKTACQLVGVGNNSMWALIKAGRVKTVSIGRRRLVIYASLEALLSNSG